MEAGNVWPLCMNDEEIIGQMEARGKALKRNLRHHIFWTMIFTIIGAWYVEIMLTEDHLYTKILFGLYILWILSSLRGWAEKWTKTQEDRDAVKAAITSWQSMVGKDDMKKEFARTQIMEATIGMQASILVAEHAAWEASELKRMRKEQKKAEKKARKGGSGERASDDQGRTDL